MRYALWICFILCSIIFSSWAQRGHSHEMSPAYPEFSFSHLDGLMKTSLVIFNRREDVSFYELEVFDKDWQPVMFAAESRIVRLNYLQKKTLYVYIRRKDLNIAEYICTRSRLLSDSNTITGISSRICSRVVNDK